MEPQRQVEGTTRSLRARQAAATRELIVRAAAGVFQDNGYRGARMEDIAGRAGVAYPTVYKAFSNKRNLLAATVQRAMTGGAEDRVDRQQWFTEQLDEPDPRRQLRLVARNARRLNERAGRLLEVVRAAARTDAHIDAVWREINDERLARARRTATTLARKTQTRGTVAHSARTLWTLTLPEIYVAQVHSGGVTAAAYERWLGDVLVAALLPDP
jgi:AcrR family transcriptional regulator